MTRAALRLRVRGVVQGVGFRPFVHRLAGRLGLAGWVFNDPDGVEIHLEGPPDQLEAFVGELTGSPPPAANIAAVERRAADPQGLVAFEIQGSAHGERPTAPISPDLPVCAACLAELRDPGDRRRGYPYINCTNCGPRYSIVTGLPYDRPRTTMARWPLCPDCAREYDDPADRRFHAQPVACPRCGPHFALHAAAGAIAGDGEAIAAAARMLRGGQVVAVKGIGGYHLACDARQPEAVHRLREKKFRKERPFALMVRDLAQAHELIELTPASERLITSVAAPIVLAPARDSLEAVAPDTTELGVMLPYAPLHHLLFAAGAPTPLVMTSANRSSEPIAYDDGDARERLAGIADAFLVGERPVARRVDDSIVRDGAFGPTILRRSRGFSPAAVGEGWPSVRPILALGGDLKSAVTLVVDGQAFVSQYIGDLEHLEVRTALRETCSDLCAMYGVALGNALVVHDAHPDYISTRFAAGLPGAKRAVQHHRAHVASVLAERGEWTARVVGVAADGTGYGDDGAIWGGEFFVGSLGEGFERVARLRPALLPGGDAAALFPPQAAAGFLAQLDELPDLCGPPFELPERLRTALALARRGAHCHRTTSLGRLFDAVAALCGFTREITFEGQAAMWLEQQARRARRSSAIALPWDADELDFRPAMAAALRERKSGRDPAEIALGFHRGLARALAERAVSLAGERGCAAIALSGGVFQNALLLEEIRGELDGGGGPPVWVNHEVPPNDGGVSLGQAAIAVMQDAQP